MTPLKFIGGPKDTEQTGDNYAVGKHDAIPSRISNRAWKGHYEYLAPHPKSITRFTPYFAWRGK